MTAIIEVKDLVKVFDGKIRAVDGITFDVEEGEIFGFLGPNGAGKSTTINMLVTLHRPTERHRQGDGHWTWSRMPRRCRQVIGLVPQDLTVDDDLSGRENMMLQADLYNVNKKDAKERIDELLKLVNLEDAADRMVKTYSGGMRKRLELAEGLIHRPKRPLPGRADVGPGHPDPDDHVGAHSQAEAGAQHDRVHDHPLPGGGGQPVRPHRHHRPRSDHGPGHTSHTEALLGRGRHPDVDR